MCPNLKPGWTAAIPNFFSGFKYGATEEVARLFPAELVLCSVAGLADAFEGHDPLGHAAVEQTVFGRFCGQLADGRQPQIDGSRRKAGRFQKGPGSTDSRRLREDESIEKYADHKGLVITNTARQVHPNSKGEERPWRMEMT